MGTFHTDKSALHGITVVVDTKGPKVYVGRCDDEDDEKVVLVDADEHTDGQNGRSKAQYVERAAKFGVWKKHDHVIVPRTEVASIRKLGEQLESSLNTLAQAKAETPPVKTGTEAGAAAPAAAGTADGAATLVRLTPAAQAEVRRLIQEQGGKPGLGLRLGVKGGGCSGFSYKLDFDQKKEGDNLVSYGDFNVYLDRKSVIYLRGITLDHQKGLAGRGFVFTNPNATNTCGCGESFAV